MGWESSDVFIFDLEPLLQGQTRTAKLKISYNSLIIGLKGLQCETILRTCPNMTLAVERDVKPQL